MKILSIVEDSATLNALEDLLTVIDYPDQHRATDATSAVKAIQHADPRFDCILLDIDLPGEGGESLISRIRDRRGYGVVPIIVITTLEDRAQIARAMAAGALDYIVKPVALYELETRLHGAELRNAEMVRLARLAADRAGHQKAGGPLSRRQSGRVFADDNAANAVSLEIAAFQDLVRALPPETLNGYLIELARQLTRGFADWQGSISYEGEGVYTLNADLPRVGSERIVEETVEQAVTRAAPLCPMTPHAGVTVRMSPLKPANRRMPAALSQAAE
ncbi:MAG: response regulator [Sulfitobacter sp.]|nr:response regulator [Sulfitobacter sp.]